jgi:HKD family nuclease
MSNNRFAPIQTDPYGNIENPPFHNQCRVMRCNGTTDSSDKVCECSSSSTSSSSDKCTSSSTSSTSSDKCTSSTSSTSSIYFPPNSTIDSIEKHIEDIENHLNVRVINARDINTYTIKYYPRLIKVPSDKYKDINCAIDKLSDNAGGYVIQLAKGTHCISRDIIGRVDNLKIIGDTNPFVGVGFINGSGIKFFTDPLLARERKKLNSRILGLPPYTLTLSGRKIIVKGSGRDPDFTCIESNRSVTFFFTDGSQYQYLIASACGNTIILDDNLSIDVFGPTHQFNLGEGFVINPNVTITTNLDVLNLEPTNYLSVRGVFFNIGYGNLGMPTTNIELAHCVLPKTSQLFILGRYNITEPNVFNGIVNLPPASSGIAYFQTFVGEVSRLVADGCGSSAWKFSTFASSASPVKLLNGSMINFQGSAFVNNCLGLYVSDGSHATIYSCVFNGNKFGLLAIYNAVVSARTSFYLAAFNIPPIFVNNTFAIVAEWGAYVIIQKACFCNNVNHCILDSRVYTTAESLPVGQYGQENSLILETINPSAVDAGSTSCASSDEQGALTAVSDQFMGITALQSIVSRSVINGQLLPSLPSAQQGKVVGNLLPGDPPSTSSSSSSSSTVTIGAANVNTNNIITVPDAIGSGFQQRAFLNFFGPVSPSALISFLGCDPCENIGSF